MYCPNCGKTNSAEQKFCRSCGLGLEKIVQSIAEQLPREGLDKQLQDRTRVVDRWLNIIGGTAVSILVVSVLWGIIYKIIIVKGEVLEGSIFLAFVLAIILLPCSRSIRIPYSSQPRKDRSAVHTRKTPRNFCPGHPLNRSRASRNAQRSC